MVKKITERAGEIARQRFGTLQLRNEQALATLGQALDEWQASVEERLRARTPEGVCGNVAPRSMVGVGLTCMLAPGHTGPHSDGAGELPMLWGGATEFAISDAGPSKYDAEPTEIEE